jgi:hypothetical protein
MEESSEPVPIKAIFEFIATSLFQNHSNKKFRFQLSGLKAGANFVGIPVNNAAIG